MTDAHTTPLTDSEQRVADLLRGLFDDGLAENDQRELSGLISSDSAARALYYDYVEAHTALRHHLGAPMPVVSSTPIPIYLPGCEPKPSRFRPHHYAIAIAAALLVAGIAVAIVSVVSEQNRQREIEQQKAELAERIAKRPVATLIESTGKLNTPHGYPAEGSSYGRGEYTLDTGTAEFMLTNAVNVKLRGDSRLFMRNDVNVALTRGSASFVVPKDATGFTVHLPDGTKVVDLGTAFRVEVDKAGHPNVRVIEGSVEIIPAPGHVSREPIVMVAGQRANWQDNDDPIQVAEAQGIDPEDIVLHLDFKDGDAPGHLPGTHAKRFNGVDDRVRLVDLDHTFEHGLTLITRVRITSLKHRYNSLVHTDGWDREGQIAWLIRSTGELAFHIYGEPPSEYVTGPVLTDEHMGRYVFLALVYDPESGQVTHYLNGEAVGQRAIELEQTPVLGPLDIGHWSRGIDPRGLHADVDTFFIVDRAVEKGELERLYQIEDHPPKPTDKPRGLPAGELDSNPLF